MLTPRPYLSFSQMTTFEMSPEKYADHYIHGKKQYVTKNMRYGSMLAEGLEDDEATGDPLLDLMASRIPKFERMDLPVEDVKGVEIAYHRGDKEYQVCVPVLKNDGGNIPLLALPDSSNSDYSKFKEYKTSVRTWTQRMADQSGQITFYATAMWIVRGKVPSGIELVNVPVKYAPEGDITPTGEIVVLPTKRTLVDIIKMITRMKKAWKGITELYESEIL